MRLRAGQTTHLSLIKRKNKCLKKRFFSSIVESHVSQKVQISKTWRFYLSYIDDDTSHAYSPLIYTFAVIKNHAYFLSKNSQKVIMIFENIKL